MSRQCDQSKETCDNTQLLALKMEERTMNQGLQLLEAGNSKEPDCPLELPEGTLALLKISF